ncbi:MAG: type IV secretory system conjugative DNA transfer family protein [Candidatus Saccharimonadales bacterium]
MHDLIDTLINGPARYTVEHHFGPLLTIVFILGILFAEVVALYALGFVLVTAIQNIPAGFRALLRRLGMGEKDIPHTFLELTFPADTSKSAFATEQLHILLRGTVKYYGFWDHLAARKKPYSLELVGTRDDGIRYILMIPAREAEAVRHNLLSFLPRIKIKQIDDYMSSVSGTVGTVELKLAADFVLPLKDHKALEEHDPIAYPTGHMTKLAKDELIAYQIVATPIFNSTHHRVVRKINDMVGRISLGKEVSSKLEVQRTPLGYLGWMLWFPPVWFIGAMGKLAAGVGGIIGSIFSSDHRLPEFMNSNKDKRPSDNPYELELDRSIKTKLDQQLFEVTIRLLVVSPDGGVVDGRLDALVDSFRPFTSAYQSIRKRHDVPILPSGKKHLSRFRLRILSPHHLSQQTILSSSELSDLYHFPNTDMVKTEGFIKSRSRELATPLSIRHSESNLDVIVGANEHGGDYQEIGMTLEQRQKHTYVIGKTGTGKTTLLKSSIYQDMLNGKGLAVFDPHGDMFQELLAIVPKHRQKDVVVFDPSDSEWPIGLNILDPGIEFESEDIKHARITSTVLSVFKKLADDNQWGPRMEHVLRNATLTALHLPNPSLYTLQRLLTDKKYQREVAKTLKDPVLKQFWDKEFKLLGSMQMSTVTAPLTHRLGHFITSKMSRHILLQGKSTVRIADIMNEGKILLVNLSKGDIGEDQSQFFGTILTSFIWMAAYQRTKIPEKQRRDFFVYVDEFQNFATPQFSEITSEGRKYHISLIVSHQNLAQIEDKDIVKVVASNASTIICLKVGPEDETFILPYMRPEVEQGDIVNLAPYHFYMKTTGDVSEDAFSGMTGPLDVEESSKVKGDVIAHSRKHYATPKVKVEKYMEQLFKPGDEKESRSQRTSTTGKNPRAIHEA